MGTKAWLIALALFLVWAAGDAGPLASYSRDDGSGLVEEHIRIPAASGRYTIATTIVRPRSGGPFGTIVLNHGVPVSAWARRLESADMLLPAAEALPGKLALARALRPLSRRLPSRTARACRSRELYSRFSLAFNFPS